MEALAGSPVAVVCADGFTLHGHVWEAPWADAPRGTIVINPATGVLARYYHHYARWLAGQGFRVVTYDYRGIGLSRPARLRGSGIRWRDWGERDFEAILGFVRSRDPEGPLAVVGHSIGGFLIGLAPSAPTIGRILTVGAQYAYCRDYARAERAKLFLRWHVAMPALTALFGFFPGRRLGWLEDLPAGVVREWSFRGARMERTYPARDRAAILARFAAVRAPILAVGLSDDPLGTERALLRSLSYFTGAERSLAMLTPGMLGQRSVGHFALFHTRFRDDVWPETVAWLRDGVPPWRDAAITLPSEPKLLK